MIENLAKNAIQSALDHKGSLTEEQQFNLYAVIHYIDILIKEKEQRLESYHRIVKKNINLEDHIDYLESELRRKGVTEFVTLKGEKDEGKRIRQD